jgi:hypothetical protein
MSHPLEGFGGAYRSPEGPKEPELPQASLLGKVGDAIGSILPSSSLPRDVQTSLKGRIGGKEIPQDITRIWKVLDSTYSKYGKGDPEVKRDLDNVLEEIVGIVHPRANDSGISTGSRRDSTFDTLKGALSQLPQDVQFILFKEGLVDAVASYLGESGITDEQKQELGASLIRGYFPEIAENFSLQVTPKMMKYIFDPSSANFRELENLFKNLSPEEKKVFFAVGLTSALGYNYCGRMSPDHLERLEMAIEPGDVTKFISSFGLSPAKTRAFREELRSNELKAMTVAWSGLFARVGSHAPDETSKTVLQAFKEQRSLCRAAFDATRAYIADPSEENFKALEVKLGKFPPYLKREIDVHSNPDKKAESTLRLLSTWFGEGMRDNKEVIVSHRDRLISALW